MEDIMNKIDEADPVEVKKIFKELVSEYLTPAYGSMSKREFDILLFVKLQQLKIIGENPELYEIVYSFKVTRAKARNLLYESKMRSSSKDKLDEELRKLLIDPIFLKENDKIAIEVNNPFLSDHLKWKLKQLGHITDGSFSPELIKLTQEAYVDLFTEMLPEGSQKKLLEKLVSCGAKKDKSIKAILRGILENASGKILGKSGEVLVENCFEYLSPLIHGKIEELSNIYRKYFQEIEPEKKSL